MNIKNIALILVTLVAAAGIYFISHNYLHDTKNIVVKSPTVQEPENVKIQSDDDTGAGGGCNGSIECDSGVCCDNICCADDSWCCGTTCYSSGVCCGNNACSTGQICCGGRCYTAQSGYICTNSVYCQSSNGACCNSVLISGICPHSLSIGDSCTSSEQCESGTCTSGVCSGMCEGIFYDQGVCCNATIYTEDTYCCNDAGCTTHCTPNGDCPCTQNGDCPCADGDSQTCYEGICQ